MLDQSLSFLPHLLTLGFMVNDPSAIASGTAPGNLTAQPPPLHYSLIRFTAARKVLQHVDIADIRHLNSFQ